MYTGIFLRECFSYSCYIHRSVPSSILFMARLTLPLFLPTVFLRDCNTPILPQSPECRRSCCFGETHCARSDIAYLPRPTSLQGGHQRHRRFLPAFCPPAMSTRIDWVSADITHLCFRIEEVHDHNVYVVQDQEGQEVSPCNRRNRTRKACSMHWSTLGC